MAFRRVVELRPSDDGRPARRKRPRYSVSISHDAFRALDSYARERGVSMSSVADAALREYCNALDTRTKRPRRDWCSVVVLPGPNGAGG